jgi:short-subunit dehydrogenase
MSRPTALITGASSGIGAAFARALANQGHDLVVTARDRSRLEALAAQLESKHGVSCEVLVADLADASQLALVEDRLRLDGPLSDGARPHVDLLINNAGFGSQGPFAELPLDGEDGQIRVNVLALQRLTHAALPGMISRRKGAIINVGSIAGRAPLPYNATYGATKAFVASFSEAVHEEVRPHGVKVICLEPGFTKTEFQKRAGAEEILIPGRAWMTPESVVDAALAALSKGPAVVVPGLQNQFLAAAARNAPRSLVRRIAGRAASHSKPKKD